MQCFILEIQQFIQYFASHTRVVYLGLCLVLTFQWSNSCRLCEAVENFLNVYQRKDWCFIFTRRDTSEILQKQLAKAKTRENA
jgi:hypothetical protein